MTHLSVERMFRVLILVNVRLQLLLAVALEVLIILFVHGVKSVFFNLTDVSYVLLVHEVICDLLFLIDSL